MILNPLPRNHLSLLFLAFVAVLAILPASTLDCYYPLTRSPNNNTCIKPCSDYQFYYEEQRICKDHCPSLGHHWTVEGVKICQLPCPSYLVLHLHGKNQQCIEACPSGFKVDEVDSIRQCVKICPEDQFYTDVGSSQCLQDCPFVEETAQGARLCKFPCQKTEFWNPGTNECSSECLAPLAKETVADVHLCKYPCQKGEFWDQEAKTCKKTCSSPYWIRSGHLGLQSCEKPCNSEDLYWTKENKRCEKECPEFWIPSLLETVKTCKFPCSRDYFYNTQTKVCQDSCLEPWSWKQDFETKAKLCYNRCKIDEVRFNNECKKECPFPWETRNVSGAAFCVKPCADIQIWDNETLSCRNTCPGSMIEQKINEVQSCVPRCNKTDYFSFADKTCYSSCPEPLIADVSDGINACHKPCRTGDAYDPKTKRCVQNCPPLNKRVDGDHGVQSCVPYCEKGLIFSPFGCVEACEEPSVLVEEGGLEFCQLDCPEGSSVLYPFKECVSTCPRTHNQKLERKMNKYLQEEFVDVCRPKCLPWDPLRLDNGECFSSQNDFGRKVFPTIQNCPEGEMMEVHAGFSICRKPCKQQEFWNEVTLTCDKSCPEPWKSREVDNNTKICFKPCSGSEYYLAEMQMCLSSCPSLWTPETIGGVNLCKPPCGPSEYYRPDNKACSSWCPRSWLINRYRDDLRTPEIKFQHFVRICEKPCASGEFKFEDGTCRPSCPKYWSVDVADEISYCAKCGGHWWVWFEEEKKCVSECPDDHYASLVDSEEYIWACTKRCTEEETWEQEQRRCIKKR